MTASSLAPGWIAPFERVGVPAVSAVGEEAVIFVTPLDISSAVFDRRLARLVAVESLRRVRDARGVTAAEDEPFGVFSS
jgi:hypothetical protein